MATGITGLFSAGDLASAENQSMRDRAMEKAKLSVGEAGAYTASLGSGMLIEGLAGMAGMKTRAQKKQEDVQGILSKYATADQNDPQVLFSLSQDFIQAGYPQLSQSFAERARTLSDTLADNRVNQQKADTEAKKAENAALGMKEGETKYFPAGAENPGKEKMMIVKDGKWVDFKDPTTGEVLMKDQFKKDKPSTFEEKKAYILSLEGKIDPATGKVYTQTTLDSMVNLLLSPDGVNIDFGAQDSFEAELGKLLAKEQNEEIKIARLNRDSFEKTNNVLHQLNKTTKDGKREVNVGFFSTMKQGFDKVFAAFGSEDAMRAATGTEMLEALLGSDVFPLIKSLGIGARGLDTPAEREFLQKVMTGTIKMEGDALEQLTRMRQKYSARAIDEYNRRVTEADEDGLTYYSRYESAQGRKLQVIEVPKLVRPKERTYTVDDGKGGTMEQKFPTRRPLLDDDGNDTGERVYQYRPNGPLYDERGRDITAQFPEAVEQLQFVGGN